MTTFVLIPGADGRAWYWHRLTPLLERAGHKAIPVDLPQDKTAGYDEYVGAIIEAMQGTDRPVLVAQSLAGFVAPVVAHRIPVSQLVLLNAMIPAPGETAGEWWDHVGHEQARGGKQFDLMDDFFHDVPPEVTAEALSAAPGGPSDKLFEQQWPLESWPDVPTRVLQGADDRFFPLPFQERIAKQRLGIEVEEMPGGHLLALSQPDELALRLMRPAAE